MVDWKRRARGGSLRCARQGLALVLALSAAASAAQAQEPVRIGMGFGFAFLPAYICEDLKLIEKHGKEAHLDLKVSYPRFLGAGPVQDAIAAGAIEMGPYGIAPLLTAWEKYKGMPRQILAVSGMTTLPVVLLANRSNIHSIADFRPADRIAVPTLSSPEVYLLQMQSEKVFGRYDRLKEQMVALPHSEALATLISGTGPVAGYFSSAPYSEIALADGRVHKLFSTADVLDGKASFLMLGATRSYVGSHAKVVEAVVGAMDEAAGIIHDDPRRAAQIYLVHEPWKTLDTNAIETVISDVRDEFGSAVHGVQAFADFMSRHGELKSPPQSWKEIVTPALTNSPSG